MSLRKRSAFKFITNIISFFIGVTTQAIVPRSLGPVSYGNFSFLTSFFSSIIGFLNFNSSTVFFTKLSQRQNEKGLVRFYFYFLVLLSCGLIVFLSAAFLTGIKELLWPSQKSIFIIMAAVWAVITFLSVILSDISDAYGLTVKSELIKAGLKIFGLGIVFFMLWKNLFSLFNFFVYQLALLLFLTSLLLFMIKKNGHSCFGHGGLNKSQLKGYAKEFLRVCLPLAGFLSLALVEQILDRWFLQKFSGSEKQGFYAFGLQVGAICLLFTTAIVPLVLREQAISFGNKDFDELKKLFSRSLYILYALTAFICCFLAVEARSIIHMFAGQAYTQALVPLTLMCLMPIHQTYGQLNGNFFFATERVNIYRNIGLFFVAVGLPLTFFLLGPKSKGALQLGAEGLAVKVVLLQFISVNIQLWFNSRFLKIDFKKLFINQFVVVLIFLAVALLSSYAISVFLFYINTFMHFLISGIIYSVFITMFFLLKPEIFSLTKLDVSNLVRFVTVKLNSSVIWK